MFYELWYLKLRSDYKNMFISSKRFNFYNFFVGFEKRKIIFSFVVFPLLAEPLNRTSGGQAKNGWLEEVQNTSRGDWLLATASWTV